MENTDLFNNKTFEVELMDTGRWNNLFCGAFFFIYTLLSSGVIRLMDHDDLIFFTSTVLVMSLIAQFIVAPRTNRILLKEISDRLERNKKGELSVNERTALLKDLLQCPKVICIEVILVVLGASIIPILILIIKFHISIRAIIYITICCIAGLYTSGIQSFCYAETLCIKKATSLVSQGINSETIHRDQFYGESTKNRILYFCILPTIIGALIQIAIIYMSVYDGWNIRQIMINFAFVLPVNAIVIYSIANHMQESFSLNTKKIIQVLELLTENHKDDIFLPTDLSNEFSYSIYLIDELINYLRDISVDTALTGENIAESSQKLSLDANITAETSISEAAAIRQCLATMENAKQQHKDISSQIDLIQRSAYLTKNSADTSSTLLSSGIQKMAEITQSNLETIYGIKDLSDKIEAIHSVVNAIDSVAERTKTIAFNAELEASIAGEKGDKFHIVSNEILRLAASMKNSIFEIRQRLTDILHSCDNLIISSESGTQKTREGSEFYSKLEQHFKELCISSDITAESLKKTVDITDVQQSAFEQINTTLFEINSGFESFSQTSQRISIETKSLRETAANLGFKSKTGGKS